jgi:hypothetical protein
MIAVTRKAAAIFVWVQVLTQHHLMVRSIIPIFVRVFAVKRRPMLISYTREAVSVVVGMTAILSVVINVVLRVRGMMGFLHNFHQLPVDYVAMSSHPEFRKRNEIPIAVRRTKHAVQTKVAQFLITAPAVNQSVSRVCAVVIGS